VLQKWNTNDEFVIACAGRKPRATIGATLTPDLTGRAVLHYRILRPIGSGGMGVVYEAEDTKLGRRVALKFLPASLARDPEALERFSREARAASALNHPNICTIHAIEEHDGDRFIVMELLEGESLDRRIADRPLAWTAMLDIAIQVADALDAAHQRGVIHRDVKPANIFVTRDGRAKVLDFGVAKLTPALLSESETVGVASAAASLTHDGTAVGTIAYMSPEQARGEPLDARTDVFSLAAVVYEMATGRRAFDGRTTAVIFQKLLEGAPDPPREVNPSLPHRFEDVILRGLEKDTDLRYQSAADLRSDLKRIRRDSTSGRLPVAPPVVLPVAPLSSGAVIVAEARRYKKTVATAAMLLLVLTAAAGYGFYALAGGGGSGSDEASGRVQAPTPTRLTTTGNVSGCASISPDGKYVVYCDFARQLKVHQVATGSTIPLGIYNGATIFSPDGNHVYVSSTSEEYPDGVLWAIPTLGGEPRRVATNIQGPVAPSPDGKRLAFVRLYPGERATSLVITDVDGGHERRLATGSIVETWLAGLGVAWSPNGRYISATQYTVVGGYRARLAVVDLETEKLEVLQGEAWTEAGRTVWFPDNRHILISGRQEVLGAHQFWVATYPEGSIRRMTNDARGFGNVSVSMTSDGKTIATVPVDELANLYATNAEATEPLQRWTAGAVVDGENGIAVNGARVVYASGSGADVTVWSVEGPGVPPRRLSRGYAETPSTPDDGSFIAFQALDGERFRVWRMERDGSRPRVLSNGEDDVMPVVSPDGRWVYYAASDGGGGIRRVPANGGDAVDVSQEAGFLVDISRDGQQLLVTRFADNGRASIIDSASGRLVSRLPTPAEHKVKWGRRPDLLAYIETRDGVANLWEQTIAGGPPRQLTRFTEGHIFNFAYSKDRTRLFLSRGSRRGDVVLLRGLEVR
jgi:serine/threonine protein kinase/Tol biopolymer transport system component